MADISSLLPERSPVVDAIYAYHKRRGDSEQSRQYLGMSEIGGPCERRLWYSFRHCYKPSFDGRLYRLFETGNLAEARFVSELRAIGCEVHDRDESGGQFSFSELGGHFSGHMDGCAVGIPGAEKTWVVLEFKSHNAKSFAKLQKDGVKAAKPQHWAQCQCYMRASGMKRALYLAYCKDDDSLYAERIHFDSDAAETLMARAERIINATTPPERISNRPDYFECQLCPAKKLCWGLSDVALPVPAINCRQCCHATPMMDGRARWQCEKHKRSLSPTDQAKACNDHLTLPGLINFAEPVGYTDGAVTFSSARGEWIHGKGGFSTRELMTLSDVALTNQMLKKAKEVLGATVTASSPDDILSRYPESDCRVVWKGAAGLLKTEWQTRYKEDLTKLSPIARCEEFGYVATEYSGGRVAILWTEKKEIGAINCEIREGVE